MRIYRGQRGLSLCIFTDDPSWEISCPSIGYYNYKRIEDKSDALANSILADSATYIDFSGRNPTASRQRRGQAKRVSL